MCVIGGGGSGGRAGEPGRGFFSRLRTSISQWPAAPEMPARAIALAWTAGHWRARHHPTEVPADELLGSLARLSLSLSRRRLLAQQNVKRNERDC